MRFFNVNNAPYAVIDSETYMLHTGPEFPNEVPTLESYDGIKAMTVYVKGLEFFE